MLWHLDISYRDIADVGTEEDYLYTIIKDAGFLQDRAKRRACPAGVADAAGEKGEAVVARAFHCENDLLPRPRLDGVERQVQGLFDEALVDRWSIEGADVTNPSSAKRLAASSKCGVRPNLS